MNSTDPLYLPDQGDKIIRTRERVLDPNIRSLPEELFKALHRHGDNIAQIDAATGESDTFASMLERCVRVAVNLKRMGVTPEDILTPCTDNHLNTAVLLIAIILTGTKVASIDPFAPDDDRRKQLALIEPKMMFCSMNALPRAAAIVKKLNLDTQIIVFGRSEQYLSFDELLVPHIEDEKIFTPYIPKSLFEPLAILFSSGTTGTPCGIYISHYWLLCGCLPEIVIQSGNKNPTVLLAYTSLVWGSAILLTCNQLILGNARLVSPAFEPERTWRYLQKYKVAAMFLVITDVLDLINARPSDVEIPHFKALATGAVAWNVRIMQKIINSFPGVNITTSYGQTEALVATSHTITTSEGLNGNLASCGQPLLGWQIKIVHPDTGEVLGPNETGEICVKSKTVMAGYHKQDSSHRFDSDGFLKTGDLLYYDDNRNFYFVDRLKHVLRYKMCSINPADIEGILYSHPAVELAAVIGVPSDGGDLPVGIVVRRSSDITAKELEKFVADRIDHKKKLHGGVIFVDKTYIPLTPSGKIRSRLLRSKILEDGYHPWN